MGTGRGAAARKFRRSRSLRHTRIRVRYHPGSETSFPLRGLVADRRQSGIRACLRGATRSAHADGCAWEFASPLRFPHMTVSFSPIKRYITPPGSLSEGSLSTWLNVNMQTFLVSVVTTGHRTDALISPVAFCDHDHGIVAIGSRPTEPPIALPFVVN